MGLVVIVNAKFRTQAQIDDRVLTTLDLFRDAIEDPVEIEVRFRRRDRQNTEVIDADLGSPQFAAVVTGAEKNGGGDDVAVIEGFGVVGLPSKIDFSRKRGELGD